MKKLSFFLFSLLLITACTKSNDMTIDVKGVSFTMKQVEGGTFQMGATPEQGNSPQNDEKPAHQVTLSTYYICETEVTQALWEAVMGDNPSNFRGINKPVHNVSYITIVEEFLPKLNRYTGKQFRLPTEAEWEFAARGGNKSKGYKYAGSNNLDEVAVYSRNSSDKGESDPAYGPQNVKSKKPNELGLYDMNGNVLEWCHNWNESYSREAQVDPQGPETGNWRVIRGGGWGSLPGYCRVSSRTCVGPKAYSSSYGFRLAL